MPKIHAKDIDNKDKVRKLVRHPTPITTKQFQHILTYISRGLTIRAALKEMKLNTSSWDSYLRTVGESELSELTRAKELQADALGERVLELMDDVVTRKLNPHEGRVAMDGAKWLASKYKPKTYSDRLQHDHNVKIDIGAVIIDARNRMKQANVIDHGTMSDVNEGGSNMRVLEAPGDPKKG